MHTYPASSTAGLNTSNLTTLYFTVRQDDTLKMPEHSGSMLRGAFGVALRSLTCITELTECGHCPLKQHCKFPRLFENPALQMAGIQAVNPYVIHVPAPLQQSLTYKKGDIWHFGMTLMGAAVHETNLIIKAWQLALQTGLGAHTPYRRARLLQVTADGQVLYSASKTLINSIDKPTATALEQQLALDSPTRLTLKFLTPFRYQQNNHIISRPDQLDSVTFIASLYNRIRLCQDNHSPNQRWDIGYDDYHEFKADIATLDITVDITANHVARRSNRQQRKMQLYGLQGDIHLTGDRHTLHRLLPALQLGERLHIGKNTTMGLGQYQLKLTTVDTLKQ